MHQLKKISILLIFTMIVNILAFPVAAMAQTIDNNAVYEQGSDTTPYITEDDTKIPAIQAPGVKAKTVLDISKGSITITQSSVTGFTPDGAAATFNPEGYEITGTTDRNSIEVRDEVPITLRDYTISNTARVDTRGINMVSGGTITLLGTNTMRREQDNTNSGFIGQDSGIINIVGNGTLNITDNATHATMIGGNFEKQGACIIGGNTTVNLTTTVASRVGAILGGGVGSSGKTQVLICQNTTVKINQDSASMGAAIGLSGYDDASPDITAVADITIADRADITIIGGTYDTKAALIGTGYKPSQVNATVKILVRDSVRVKLLNGSTNTTFSPLGMGLPTEAPITSEVIARSEVTVSPWSNVDAPSRENYYKGWLDGKSVYKTEIAGLTADTAFNIYVHGTFQTFDIKTTSDGKIYLYLKLGAQTVEKDGTVYKGEVDTSGNTILLIENILTAADIHKEVVEGTAGIDLTGHAKSTIGSTGAITYTVTNAGTTGATLTGNTLKWRGVGTADIKATQAAAGLDGSGTVTFSLNVVAPSNDGVRGVLDVSKAPITITGTSVTAKTVTGETALFDADGYEIVGSTGTNTIVVRDAVPITINGITLDYKTADISIAINMVNGGEITVISTNTINNHNNTNRLQHALIGQDSGQLIINGTGTLNMTDYGVRGPTIGGNDGLAGNIQISGDVIINAIKIGRIYSSVIGSGHGATSSNTKVEITGNATVNASIDGVSDAPVIGLSIASTGQANITISGRAQLTATGGNGNTIAPVIGIANDSQATANITIEDGTKVKLVTRSEASSINAGGIGLPEAAPITISMLSKSNIKVSPLANIDAPVRENYYRALDGIAQVYKAEIQGLPSNTDVNVTYAGDTAAVKTFEDGRMYLYLPLGGQTVDIDGEVFEGIVANGVTNRLFIKTILTAADISRHVSEGAEGINLRGHETTNSTAVIRHAIKDAGTTVASLDKGTLTWKKPGIVKMNVSQAADGKYSAASTDFTVTLTINNGDIEIQVSVDVGSVGFGRVAVINKNGKEILPFVQPGEALILRGLPNEGYELAKWEKTTDDGTRAITTEELAAIAELKITAKENEGYIAFFKLKDIVPGPKLAILEVSSMVIQQDGTLKEEKKPLIRQDGSEDVRFDSDKLEYGLYLRSIDTNNINIYVRHSDTQDISIKIGDLGEVEFPVFDGYKVSLPLSGTQHQEIPILVKRGTETTKYVIQVFKNQKAENDPHLYADFKRDTSKDISALDIYAVNTDVNAFDMTIRIDELLASNEQAFVSFTNNEGKEFTHLNVNLADDIQNYLNLNSDFELADMRSNGKLLTLTVNLKLGRTDIKIGKEPLLILSINIKRNLQYVGAVGTEIDTLRMEQVIQGDSVFGNSLSSKFYGDLNDTYNPKGTREEDKRTLSYLEFRGELDTIKMYVSYDANKVGRVTYEIVDVAIPDNHKVAVVGDVVNYEIRASVLASTYRVRVLAGGYLLAESEDVVYDGQPSKSGIIMTPVRLLEGDLDGNNSIDGQDRIKLLSVLNKRVQTAGSGFVTVANENIYADYNNDNRINSLDLGRLVQNIGKKYSLIHAV